MPYNQPSVNQRILKFANSIGLSDVELARRMGVKKQFVTEWKNNTNNIPPKRLIEFVEQFPELNARWVFYGEGNMIKSDGSKSNNQIHTYGRDNKIGQVNFDGDANYTEYNGDEKLQIEIAFLKRELNEKNERITELKERIEEMNSQIERQQKTIDKLLEG